MTTAKPRVAIVSRAIYPYHGYGGLEKHVYHLAVHLQRLGVEISVYASLPPVRGCCDAAADVAAGLDDIPIHFTPYTLLPLRPNSVAARITNYPVFVVRQGREVMTSTRRGCVNIIHAHGLSGFGCAWERRRSGTAVPLITNPHGLEDFKVRDIGRKVAYSFFRAMYKYGARMSERTIATDEVLVPEIEDYLGVRPERIAVLPNAVDVEECLSLVDHAIEIRLRSGLGLINAQPLIMSVGRLEENKGFDVALRALSAAQHKLPADWRWVIIGSGSQRAALEAGARAAGIAGHVVFAGALSDRELHSLFALADLFVHPTLYEGSSIVTLEAMAHSLPVVASRAGGIPDKVIDGITGYLVNPGDASELSARIIDCVSDMNRARLIGKAGRRRVEDGFSWPEVARRTVALYEEVLESID